MVRSDLTIDYTMNPVDQASDYYPFGGLMGSGFERIISKTNDFRYQGKEYDKELQWYDFHARQYDPYLGRFLAADPLMQFSSPYNGMGNNPINLIDPTGMEGTTVGGAEKEDNWNEIDHTSNNHFADQAERFGHAYRGGHTVYGTAGDVMGYRTGGSYADYRGPSQYDVGATKAAKSIGKPLASASVSLVLYQGSFFNVFCEDLLRPHQIILDIRFKQESIQHGKDMAFVFLFKLLYVLYPFDHRSI
ncbi:MAG: RHS repeat-associated core domain-containing protein [Cyclobacteriaceae bacterium]